MNKTNLWGMLILILVVTLLVGCGPSSTPTITAPTVPTTSAPTVKPTSTTTPTTTSVTTPTQASQPTITLVASTWASETYPWIKVVFYPVVQDIEQRSGGRIKFKTYTQGQLFGGADEFSAVSNGAIDLSSTWLPQYNSKDDPIFGFSKVPFLFSDAKHLKRAWDAGIGDMFVNHVAKFGVIPFSMWPLVEQVGVAYRGTMPKTPDTINGKKVRVSDPYEKNLFESLGGAGVMTTGAEAYVTLQRGIVDMAISENTMTLSYKLQEVTDGFVNYYLSQPIEVPVMNKKKFESLPPDLQQIVSDAINKASANWWAAFSPEELAAKAKIQELKPSYVSYSVTPEEKSQWMQAAIAGPWKYLSSVAGIDGDQIIRIANATRQ